MKCLSFFLEIMSKQKFEIPESGSLGLLALGYVGLVAWRKKRDELQAKNRSDQKPKSDQ